MYENNRNEELIVLKNLEIGALAKEVPEILGLSA